MSLDPACHFGRIASHILRCATAMLPLWSSSRRTMADTLARSNSSVEERTSAGRDEGLANDTQGLGSQILPLPGSVLPYLP